MNRWVHLLVLVAVALALFACVPTQPTPPPENNTFSCIGQNACNTGNTGSPDPNTTPAGGCAIAQVGNSLHGTSAQGGVKSANLRVNEQRTLDTTPHQANGQPLGGNCPIAAVTWSNTNTAACRLNSAAVYTPVVTAIATGTCELRATVGSVTASEPIVISVVP